MRCTRFVIFTIIIFALTTIIALAAEVSHIQARVYLDSKAQYLQFKNLHLDEVWQGN